MQQTTSAGMSRRASDPRTSGNYTNVTRLRISMDFPPPYPGHVSVENLKGAPCSSGPVSMLSSIQGTVVRSVNATTIQTWGLSWDGSIPAAPGQCSEPAHPPVPWKVSGLYSRS